MSGSNLQDALKDSGQGLSEGKKHETLRAALVISELALACVLLVGAGLLLHSFSARVGCGFGIRAQPHGGNQG